MNLIQIIYNSKSWKDFERRVSKLELCDSEKQLLASIAIDIQNGGEARRDRTTDLLYAI